MRVLTTLVVAAAIAGFAPSIVTAAESTGFRGVTFGATEADVRATRADTDCRMVRTQLSRYACSIRESAWGSPVTAMFVFDGEQDRRLAIITLTFQSEDQAAIERGLVSEYGQPTSLEEGGPYWTRPDAAIWLRHKSRRVVFARRDYIERATAPIEHAVE